MRLDIQALSAAASCALDISGSQSRRIATKLAATTMNN
jgi:hypothetical protein